jgi:hypothetical protein
LTYKGCPPKMPERASAQWLGLCPLHLLADLTASPWTGGGSAEGVSGPARDGCRADRSRSVLYRQPTSEFACRRVRFRATVLSDCMHGTLLTDSRCERGILPAVSQRGDRTVEPFLESICAEMPSSLDVMRMATFTGYFRLRERNAATIFALDVESVWGIRNSPKHRPSDRTPGNSIR